MKCVLFVRLVIRARLVKPRAAKSQLVKARLAERAIRARRTALAVATLALTMLATAGLLVLAQAPVTQAQAQTPPAGRLSAPTNTGAPTNAGAPSALPLKSAKGDIDFSQARPEDITNENFPKKIKSFDYPNADILEVIKAISKLTGKNFIIDNNVRGKITIIAPSEITVAEAYKAFLSALAINGYTIVPSGRFLKIRPIQEAKKDSIELYPGQYFPDSDELITRIMKLKYINAAEVEKQLRALSSKGGEITSYAPTNSLIITDLGASVERIAGIIEQLDVPGFEEKLVVIPIANANAREIADLIEEIISGGQSSRSRFGAGVPRFRRTQPTQPTSRGSGAASYSLVRPDARTNSIIVVGNKAGISRIRTLVKQLDIKLRPEDSGGVYVYYLRNSLAEKVATVLNGLAAESSSRSAAALRNRNRRGGSTFNNAATASQGVFGGDVKVTADSENNALIITASKQDYEVVKDLLRKIDIPRDQVFVETIIMEMNANKATDWGLDYYALAPDGKGAGRMGFRSGGIADLITPIHDKGAVLSFGHGKTLSINNVPGIGSVEVPSLMGLVKFLKTHSGGNVLSTPQITALDNEEASISVGGNVPVSRQQNTTAAGVSSTTYNHKDVKLELKITPFISPDTDTVKMKIEQKVDNVSQTLPPGFAKEPVAAIDTKLIKTSIVVNSGDTAVLGGLMTDQEVDSTTKVPILGDIPILGWLFKSTKKSKQKRNLVVFITPKILRNQRDSSELLDKKLSDRIDFIQRNMSGRDPHGSAVDALPRRASVDEGMAVMPSDSFTSDGPTEPEQASEAPQSDAASFTSDSDLENELKKLDTTQDMDK